MLICGTVYGSLLCKTRFFRYCQNKLHKCMTEPRVHGRKWQFFHHSNNKFKQSLWKQIQTCWFGPSTSYANLVRFPAYECFYSEDHQFRRKRHTCTSFLHVLYLGYHCYQGLRKYVYVSIESLSSIMFFFSKAKEQKKVTWSQVHLTREDKAYI